MAAASRALHPQRKAENLKLQKQATALPEPAIEKVEYPTKQIEALTAEVAGFRSDYIGKLEMIAQCFKALNGQNTINQIEQKVGKLLAAFPSVKAPVPARAPLPKPAARVAAPKTSTASGSTGELSKAERQILQALYWTKDDNSITPAKIGFYADYRAGTGSFNNALGQLRAKGLLSGWAITSEGEETASSYVETKPTGMELREWLRPKVGKCENEVLDVLLRFYPQRLLPEQLAEETLSSYKVGTGSFNNALGRLRSLEAAEGGTREGGVKAADVFFE